jgi:hypothetical protein
MTAAPRLRFALGMVAAVAALVAGRVRAEGELPSERPTTPYRATIRNTYDISRPGGGSSGGDTIEIRVSGARSLEVSRIMEEKSVILDLEKQEAIEFDPKATDKVAERFRLNDVTSTYIQGRAGLAAYNASWPAPKIVGEDKVAKQKCTVLHYAKPEEDGIAACVSKEGVVLRAKIKYPDYERSFEALDFDAAKQDEKWFRPPDGFKIVEGAGQEDTEPSE